MKLFPVLIGPGRSFEDKRDIRAAGFESLTVIPFELLEPHRRQADCNHYQTLERLAERGGLSACEAVAIIEDRPWHKMELIESYRRLDVLVRAFHEKAAA